MRPSLTAVALLLLLHAYGTNAADFAAKGVAPPTPVADYDFLGWLGDALGNGPVLERIGGPGTGYVEVTADGNTRLVLSVPEGAGLRLASGPLLPLDTYSIAMIVSLSSTNSYAKLLDTNALTVDSGLYARNNQLRYYTAGQATSTSFPDGVLRQVVVTRAANGTYTGYLDGFQQFSFDDSTAGQGTPISAQRLLHFLRDDDITGNSEESNAVIHRIRLFDSALSAAQVAALEANRGDLVSLFRRGNFESTP
ncbi:LamG domain-containing protein [Pseudomarimonas salicorniae]|uniref:LamG domain-containing protein n=1 Tax=Pseudomarimonas salicorniae TaxID=2933270 RepID=A0ABT0GED6_9GAMM|nr:LamG domain-containing protein [Lysobacter sp. CAU 1642]MCK7592911.1 LamG domain-containing protein [Lysobacter sp. CAU 1642]